MYTWEEITHFVQTCTRCSLSETRRLPVMGNGSHHATIMFIGEAPGGQEDLQGIPFIGPAGKLLDELLEETGIPRKSIYCTNIVKCRPPQNRDPAEAEKTACIPYLKAETILLRPQIIVCLGRIAAQRIIDPAYRITREHGNWIFRKNCHLTATYHPSAVLRDPKKRPDAEADFRAIRKKLDELEQNR